MNKKKALSIDLKSNQAYRDYLKKRELIDYEAMDKAIRENLLSLPEIARAHSTSDRFVRDRVYKLGIMPAERERERSRLKTINRFERLLEEAGLTEASLRDVFDDLTLSQHAIEVKFGISQAMIRYYLNKFGIDSTERARKAKKPRQEYKERKPGSAASKQLSNITTAMNGERSLWLLSHDWRTPIRG